MKEYNRVDHILKERYMKANFRITQEKMGTLEYFIDTRKGN